jgi:hypothetical protein
LIQYTEALTPGKENSEFIQDWKGYVLALGFFVTILLKDMLKKDSLNSHGKKIPQNEPSPFISEKGLSWS